MSERKNSKAVSSRGLKARIRKFITSDDEDPDPRIRPSKPDYRARASTGTMNAVLRNTPSIDVFKSKSSPKDHRMSTDSEKRLAHSDTLPGGHRQNNSKTRASLTESFDFDGKMDYYKSLNVQNIMRSMSIKEGSALDDNILDQYSPQFSPKRSVSASKITVPLKDGEREHIADDADTLAGIAVKYEVSVPLLVKHNRMSSAHILKGMRIVIPSEETVQHIQESAMTRKRLAKTAEIQETPNLDSLAPNPIKSGENQDVPDEMDTTSPKIGKPPKTGASNSFKALKTVFMGDAKGKGDGTPRTEVSFDDAASYNHQTSTEPIAIRMGADDSGTGSDDNSESDDGSYRVVGGYSSVESSDYTQWERIQSEAKFSHFNRSDHMFPCVYHTPDNDHYGMLELGRYTGGRSMDTSSQDSMDINTDDEAEDIDSQGSAEMLRHDRETDVHTHIHTRRESGDVHPHIHARRESGKVNRVDVGEGVGVDGGHNAHAGNSDADSEAEGIKTMSVPELDAVVVDVVHPDTDEDKKPDILRQDRLDLQHTDMDLEMGEMCLMYHPFDYSWVKRDPVIIISMANITGLSRRLGTTHVCAPSSLQLKSDKYGFTERTGTTDEKTMLVVRTRGNPPDHEPIKYNFDLHEDNATVMYDRLVAHWEMMLIKHPENAPGVALGDIKDGWDNDELFDIQTEMLGTSQLIDREGFEKLRKHLPEKVKYNDWVMLFDTSTCGHSLSALYRQVQGSGPNLLVMRDKRNAVFGAYFSEPLHVDERRYFGSGECFVFNLHPRARVYPWTGIGEMFISAMLTSFSIGVGDDGVPALWLSEDLLHGSSDNTETFNNAILSSSKDFQCMGLEVWGFA